MIDRIPRIPGVPLLGSLAEFLWDPLALMERARSLGDVTRLNIAGLDAVLLHHPDHIDHVLRAKHARYLKGGPFWSSAAAVLGKGLPAVCDGDSWRRQRRLIQPQFQPRRLAELTPLVYRTLEQSLEWNDIGCAWSAIDLAPRLQHLTMNVVSASILGGRVSRASAAAIGTEFTKIAQGMVMAMVAHGLPWFPGQRSFHESIAEVRRHVQRIIDERRQSCDRDSCLLASMLAATSDADGCGMTDRQLLDETVSMFIAGYETTASGLMWSLHFLAEHPEHAARVREQADEHLRGEPDHENAMCLTYGRWVMQEALRLYPPVWWLPRVAQQDDVIGGYEVRAGTIVAPVVYTAHRHPEVWEEPASFDPERFEPTRVAERHRCAWLPFGVGPRGCVGQELSLLESQLALSMIVQRFDLLPVATDRPRPRATMLIAPAKGVRLRVRNAAAPKVSALRDAAGAPTAPRL